MRALVMAAVAATLCGAARADDLVITQLVCWQGRIVALDDGRSDARTIATAARRGCLVRITDALMLAGRGPAQALAEVESTREADLDMITTQVLEHRRARR